MDVPYFHEPHLPGAGQRFHLSEESSKHAVAVLRMQSGDLMCLVDGKGNLAHGAITDAHRKKCEVLVQEKKFIEDPRHALTLCVSLLKNPSRFEWMLEKLCEIGVQKVVPMLLSRTEKTKVRADRLSNIAISAMLQSKQAWMTEVAEPVELKVLLSGAKADHKFIAHCIAGDLPSYHALGSFSGDMLMLIGPEGDFTLEEVDLALHYGCRAVRLGSNRLRSETAAVVAASLLCIG